MDEFGCDYECRTVGEGIIKHGIPDDWCAEFDAYDDVYPIVCMDIGKIRREPALMALKLRIVEDADMEYAGCMVLTDEKTVIFKIDHMQDLIKAARNTGDGSM